jgi:Domain of unknown function (DUF4274)
LAKLHRVGVVVLAVSVIALIGSFYSSTDNEEQLPSIAATTGAQKLAPTLVVPSAEASSDRADVLAGYLEKGGPDEWHKIASGWNWDGGVEPLKWIIRQPQCDRATALLVYWKGGPGFMAQYDSRDEVPSHALANYDLVKEVERRYLSDFYTRYEIAFDPRKHAGLDWTKEYADITKKQPIPDRMHQALRGRDLPESCVFTGSAVTC